MFTIFKRKSIISNKTTSQIIEEIHESFYTEVDKLLAEANIKKSEDTDKEDLLKKADTLVSLGFTNVQVCKIAQEEKYRLAGIKESNNTKDKLIKAINYFSFKYPHYKFITEESVRKICMKYGLIYGTIDKYIGTDIPTKNLNDIKNFKIDDNDRELIVISQYGRKYRGDEARREFNKQNSKVDINGYFTGYGYNFIKFQYSKLEIAAPIKDFNTQDMEIKGFKLSKIEIPDPVVLCPVEYENTKYYLIVTAWGDEASDVLVVNNKMN